MGNIHQENDSRSRTRKRNLAGQIKTLVGGIFQRRTEENHMRPSLRHSSQDRRLFRLYSGHFQPAVLRQRLRQQLAAHPSAFRGQHSYPVHVFRQRYRGVSHTLFSSINRQL